MEILVQTQWWLGLGMESYCSWALERKVHR